ncbi:MAG: hypothetical protein NVS4B8_21070 [Herpetosiphon sp.]
MSLVRRKMLQSFMQGRYWRHPIRAWRIFLAETARKNSGYKRAWESVGKDAGWTFTMMNGSPDEATLRRTGSAMSTRLVDALAITPDDRVLEIGCGVGRIGRELAPHVAEYHGCDIAAPILKLARQRTAHLPNVRLHELSRTGLPFVDNTFDRAYSHLVMFHLDKEDMFGYLEEITRVLRPGGLVYFDTWNLLDNDGWERFIWEREHHRHKVVRPAHRNQFATPEEIRLYVAKAGLEPLAFMDVSCWIQVVAAKPGPEIELDELRAGLRNLPALVPRGHWYYE